MAFVYNMASLLPESIDATEDWNKDYSRAKCKQTLVRPSLYEPSKPINFFLFCNVLSQFSVIRLVLYVLELQLYFARPWQHHDDDHKWPDPEMCLADVHSIQENRGSLLLLLLLFCIVCQFRSRVKGCVDCLLTFSCMLLPVFGTIFIVKCRQSLS